MDYDDCGYDYYSEAKDLAALVPPGFRADVVMTYATTAFGSFILPSVDLRRALALGVLKTGTMFGTVLGASRARRYGLMQKMLASQGWAVKMESYKKEKVYTLTDVLVISSICCGSLKGGVAHVVDPVLRQSSECPRCKHWLSNSDLGRCTFYRK